jgi:hypothetical protein
MMTAPIMKDHVSRANTTPIVPYVPLSATIVVEKYADEKNAKLSHSAALPALCFIRFG